MSFERCFVEVRRRTRPMVCFVNVATVDRIIFAIFQKTPETNAGSVCQKLRQSAKRQLEGRLCRKNEKWVNRT
jgi:hypothetical protein